jgi:hypothetical protein
MTGRFMIRKFANDLLVNCACGKNKKYEENKRKEWSLLKPILKQKLSLL